MITIDGVYEKLNLRSEIKDLGDFVLTNPGYLYCLALCVKQINPRNMEGYTEKLRSVLDEAVLLGRIVDDALTGDFMSLFKVFIAYDRKTSGNARGRLLEYLCYCKGPFSETLDLDNLLRLRTCVVRDKQGIAKCGNHTFDVGFCNNPTRFVELLECKWSLSNFLNYGTRNQDKVAYLVCIQQCLASSQTFAGGSVSFVTMQMSSVSEKDILEAMGYNIPIFGFEQIDSLISV